MPRTGQLGKSGAQIGSLILAHGSEKGHKFRRPSKTPHYRLQAFRFADTSTFGVGDLIAEFDKFKNLGWGEYLNSVPQMFATLNQDDSKVILLRGLSGKMHYRLWRNDDLVQVGWLGLEHDANSRDVILYGYGYMAALFWENTVWQFEWTNSTVGTIVEDGWDRATLDVGNNENHRLSWIAKGTIEEPPTTSGGSTPITLPFYSAFLKRILFLMQEMAAISASDTGNSTIFEITSSIQPRFNFWADRSSTVDLGWRWSDGKGKIADFREFAMPIYHRNNVIGIGSTPRDLILRQTITDSADQTTGGWGRMSESLFFPWVRDEDELDRVLRLRSNRAKRDMSELSLIFHPGKETPPGTSDSEWALGDKTAVKIVRGITNINETYQIVGHLTIIADGNEYVRALIQEPV